MKLSGDLEDSSSSSKEIVQKVSKSNVKHREDDMKENERNSVLNRKMIGLAMQSAAK